MNSLCNVTIVYPEITLEENDRVLAEIERVANEILHSLEDEEDGFCSLDVG